MSASTVPALGSRTLGAATVLGRTSAAALLTLLLVFLGLGLDPDGSLGTDTGGKTATLVAMVERGDWNPSIGYWAESSDPEGIAHPFFGTRRSEAGWVNVTTLPMVLVTKPLVEWFGMGALLVVPVLGSVLACLAVGELARRFGAPSWHTGFLAAATASPVVVYGLDFWEHSIGLALMLWAVWAVHASVCPMPGQRLGVHGAAVAAGVLFGLAATMRQEALVYGFVAGLAAWVVGVRRWSLPRGTANAALIAIGALAPLALGVALERAAIGETVRAGRAVGVLGSAGRTGVIQRLMEGVLITASPINLVHPLSMLLAAFVTAGIVWLSLAALRGDPLQRPLAVCGALVLMMFLRLVVFGPTFVPGMLAAVPLAGLGLAAAYHRRLLLPLVLALAPLPLVWATQYPGAAEAQWGGRYVLTSGLLLVAVAAGLLGTTHRRLLAGFLVANAVLAAVGATYVIQRTHDFGTAHRELAERGDEVVVFTDDFIAREGAPVGWDRRWLSATTEAEAAVVVDVLTDRAIERFALVSFPQQDNPEFAGFTEGRSEPLSYGSFALEITDYERSQ